MKFDRNAALLRILMTGAFVSGREEGDDEAAKKAAADKAAAEKAAADKKAADDAAEAERIKKSGMSDEAAKLLKESMERKQRIQELEKQLKSFEGIDPAEVKKLLEAQQKAAKDAEDAEKKRLAEAGDFDRLKAMMAEEHKKEVEAARTEATTKSTALDQAMATINDLTVGAAFNTSGYVSSELVLTPAKARQIYGSHFEVEKGQVVAYDKPRGAEGRTPLVNGAGKPLAFEDAIKKLVTDDPERDQLVRDQLKTGAGSKTGNDKGKGKEAPELKGAARILAALNAKEREVRR